MRGRLKQFVWGSRRRKVSAVVLSALTLSGTAVAAFFLFTGASGSGNGTFAAAQTADAITLTGTTQPQLQGPNDVQLMVVQATNNDPNAAHTLNNYSGSVFSSNPPECAAHLSISLADGSFPVGISLAAGSTSSGSLGIKAGPSIPTSCASGSWSVALAGTTTP